MKTFVFTLRLDTILFTTLVLMLSVLAGFQQATIETLRKEVISAKHEVRSLDEVVVGDQTFKVKKAEEAKSGNVSGTK